MFCVFLSGASGLCRALHIAYIHGIRSKLRFGMLSSGMLSSASPYSCSIKHLMLHSCRSARRLPLGTHMQIMHLSADACARGLRNTCLLCTGAEHVMKRARGRRAVNGQLRL